MLTLFTIQFVLHSNTFNFPKTSGDYKNNKPHFFVMPKYNYKHIFAQKHVFILFMKSIYHFLKIHLIIFYVFLKILEREFILSIFSSGFGKGTQVNILLQY